MTHPVTIGSLLEACERTDDPKIIRAAQRVQREVLLIHRMLDEHERVTRIDAVARAVNDARRAARRAAVAACGTDSGYYKHRRDGTDQCEACRAAHARAARMRTAKV